jgi:hypothetical protein
MKAARFEEHYARLLELERKRRRDRILTSINFSFGRDMFCGEDRFAIAPMGLSGGGRVKQEIYADKFGIDAWDERHAKTIEVKIVEASRWIGLTGREAPPVPEAAARYAERQGVWFDYTAPGATLPPTAELGVLQSVREMVAAIGKPVGEVLEDEDLDGPVPVIHFGTSENLGS